jgi:hypothetical protein
MNGVPYMREETREIDVAREAKIGVMCLQTKELD